MKFLLLALVVGVVACGGPAKKQTTTGKPYPPGVQEGYATFYGKEAQGGPTASGERFNMHAMTAAHRTLPMQTRVRVTNKRNGKSVVVRINDRGPFGNKNRIIDLSEAAARSIDMIEAGVVPVRLEVIK
ncbi:MAG TPA: septal ring lytic transglycosylase RlpA family protein [Kofleriaceae bacterium]|nr:septal ring lytic transglycosylase RlpA family protein [Kofleriaceae bacterium]